MTTEETFISLPFALLVAGLMTKISGIEMDFEFWGFFLSRTCFCNVILKQAGQMTNWKYTLQA